MGRSQDPILSDWDFITTSILEDTFENIGACIDTCNIRSKSELLTSRNSAKNELNLIPAQSTMSFNLQHETASTKTKSKELLPLKTLGSKSFDGLKMLLVRIHFLSFLFQVEDGSLLT